MYLIKQRKHQFTKKCQDLEFGPNNKFQIEADVSNATIIAGENDVTMMWQVMYKGKFFTLADTTRSLDTKCNRKLVGDVKPSFNDNILEKIRFSIVDSDSWRVLLLGGFLRYLQWFFLKWFSHNSV
ncbi:hypothetical protein F2Q70_00041437 [Brassica cretica]|uniref:Uncharacterized protein n=1 Tax=Brassica cretica TaxID=69181 RepID=A0A8S9MGT4_BRACR|nr:hypothetical protein F2Q70_00041437 [Brassica cretica]KAF2616486.1 hypothetical protein F2Q68_00042095 [Brassica cretica]